MQSRLETQSKNAELKTVEELNAMKAVILQEAKKREIAEKKIQLLCEKLGINNNDV